MKLSAAGITLLFLPLLISACAFPQIINKFPITRKELLIAVNSKFPGMATNYISENLSMVLNWFQQVWIPTFRKGRQVIGFLAQSLKQSEQALESNKCF